MEHIGIRRALGSALGSTTATRKVADEHHQQALAYQKQKHFDKAQEQYGKALAMGQEARLINPKKSKVYRTLAAISLDYAGLLEGQHRATEAKEVYQQAQEYADKAHKLEPKHPKVRDVLSAVNSQYRQFLRAQGEAAQADQAQEKIVQSLQIQQSQVVNRSGIAKYFSSSSNWVPFQHNPTQSHPLYPISNPAFDTHLSNLPPCAQPFFIQPLQVDTRLAYVFPQPSEPIQDTHYLAWCLRQNTASQEEKDVWMKEAKGVIERFSQMKVKGLAHVQEVVAFATLDHPQLHRSLTNALLKGLENNRLLNLALLQGVSVMVFHRTHLTEDRHSIGDYVQVLQALLGLLEKTHADQNLEHAQTLLHTLALLLDQMVYLQVKEIDRIKIETPLKTALDQFADEKKYPELAWPIQYIQQALARLPNNETFSKALIRRVLPMLGGLSYLTTFGLKVASAEIFISGFEPDKLWNAYECFKDVFAIGQSRCAPWYGELRFIDVLIGLGKLELVGKLLEGNAGQLDVPFLRGLCDRLERIASVQHDVQARDSALKLLKGIQEGQIEWAPQEAIQQYARQSLNRLARMWPTPNAEAMGRIGYAPPAWHPFWTAIPDNALLSTIQNKVRRHANQEAALYQITALQNDVQRLLPPPVSLTQLRNAFHRYYDTPDLCIQRVSGGVASLDDCYINLAIVESQAQREKDQGALKEQALAFERLPSSERVEATNPNKLIQLEQLFEKQKLCDGSEGIPKRILIQGRAGIGKTTLSKKLVHEYHHNGLWQDQFDCVVWVPLRQLKTHPVQTLENLLCRYFSIHGSAQAQALAQAFQQTHRDRTLFILDGLDEVAEVLDKRHALNHFLETLLNQVHVLITSRPAGVSASQCHNLDLELETIGFNADNIKTYIEKFAPESKQTEIQQFIDRTPLIQGLVNIPIQLDALCYSWDKLPQGQEVTMSMLYEAIVDKLWRKDGERLEKQAKGKTLAAKVIQDSPKARLEKLMKDEIDYLGYLAFKGLEEGKIEFSLEELDQRQTDFEEECSGKELSFDFTVDLKKTSYLHTADAERPEGERHYHFLHLTFQEFFAAKFLVRHLQTYTPVEKASAHVVQKGLGVMPQRYEVEAFIATHKYNPRYEIVWWMVAGLLKGVALENFFNVLDQLPRDLIGIRHQQVMMGCLNEARPELKGRPEIVETLETKLKQYFELEIKLIGQSQLGRQRFFPEHLLITNLSSYKDEIIKILRARPNLSANAIQALIEIALRDSWDVRKTVARILDEQKMLAANGLHALLGALADQDKSVKYAAASVLGDQSTLSEAAELALSGALQDQDKDVSSAAARALGGQSTLSEAAVLALIGTLKDQNTYASSAAASVLEKQKTLSEVSELALIDTLQAQDSDVSSAAASVLEKQSTLSEAAELALIDALKNQGSDISSAAARALGGQKTLSEAAELALSSALKDQDKYVKSAAAIALGDQSTLSEAAELALIDALKNQDKDISSAAARALGGQNTLSEAAELALIDALKNQDKDISSEAARALGGQKTLSEAAELALSGALQAQGSDVSSAAAYALGGHKTLSEAAVLALIDALKVEVGMSVLMQPVR